jgi:hypothetical protein
MFLVVLLCLVFFAGQLKLQARPRASSRWRVEAGHLHRPRPGTTAPPSRRPPMRSAPSPMRCWSRGAEHALKDPRRSFTAMEHWSHQFAILLLPIAARS